MIHLLFYNRDMMLLEKKNSKEVRTRPNLLYLNYFVFNGYRLHFSGLFYNNSSIYSSIAYDDIFFRNFTT